MTLTKSETIGILGTVFIHLILFVCLLLFGFNKSESTYEEDEGLTVNFGTVDEAAGLFEPAGETTTNSESVPVAPPEPASKPEKEMITQEKEATVSLVNKKKKEADQAKVKEQQIQNEQNRKASTIKNLAANAFGSSKGKGVSQGTASTGTGNQGVPTGDPNAAATSGSGTGYGHFSLNGRNLNGGLPHPSYSIQEEGVVVVRIVVSPKGNVLSSAISLQGTNTDNSTLRNAAISAAKQARFNVIDGIQNQSGTITYHFRLK